MKILIADDSPTIVEVLQFLLQQRGYEVITAADGIEAIEKTYQVAPDLLLLDIDMPRMNGYHVCRLLRSDESTKTIPIIMLTSKGQQRDRFWGLSTGADEYLTKDFESEEELFAAIQRILARRPGDSSPFRPSQTYRTTELSILERVNQILDHQLFQATIVNELSYLAVHTSSFSATIEAIFTLLAKVCDVRAAAMLLKDQQQSLMYLAPFGPTQECFLQAIQERVIQTYQEYHPTELLEHLQVAMLDVPQPPSHDGAAAEQLAMFFALPLNVRNRVIGVLALGHVRDNLLSRETLETLSVFATEASIVIDNALLVKQLEHSNQELEDTIVELKSTQAQLVQSEKMASLGQLVAGVAHEINTPAGAISAATTNLLAFLPTLPENFCRLMQHPLSLSDQTTFLKIVSRVFAAVTDKYLSTAMLRQEAKELETILTHAGLANVRRLSRQITRLELKESMPDLLDLLKRYDPLPIVAFLENCSKIVNASKDIKLSIDIVTRIVNALKMYSRIDQAKVEEIDIHEGLETTLVILHNQIKQGVTVNRQYGVLPKLACRANELNQVWTNLIHNALQAMNGAGILTIATAYRPTTGEPPGGTIVVTITDTGHGIPDTVLPKIFDPFFTTKDQGEGSGLGLGIAQQIVQRHQGEIRVTSQPGQTCFEVLLPLNGIRQKRSL